MTQDERISELRKFISSLGIEDPLSNAKVASAYKSFDKDLYAILLWGLALDLYSNRPLSEHELHMKEFLSDISTANLCALTGLYKPSMMALRSGIENFVKSILIFNKIPINDTKSLYEINDRFRNIFSNSPKSISNLSDSIINQYSYLCKYVHSAGQDFMNLTVAYADMLKNSDEKTHLSIKAMQLLCKSSNGILLISMGSPEGIHHRNKDYILDRIPRSVKMAALGN